MNAIKQVALRFTSFLFQKEKEEVRSLINELSKSWILKQQWQYIYMGKERNNFREAILKKPSVHSIKLLIPNPKEDKKELMTSFQATTIFNFDSPSLSLSLSRATLSAGTSV